MISRGNKRLFLLTAAVYCASNFHQQSVQCFTTPEVFRTASAVRTSISGGRVPTASSIRIKNSSNGFDEETTNTNRGRQFFGRFRDNEKVSLARGKLMGAVNGLMSRTHAIATIAHVQGSEEEGPSKMNLIPVGKLLKAVQATKEKSKPFSLKVIMKFPTEKVRNKLEVMANATQSIDFHGIPVKVRNGVNYSEEKIPGKVLDGVEFTKEKSRLISKSSMKAITTRTALLAKAAQAIDFKRLPVNVLDRIKNTKSKILVMVLGGAKFTKEKGRLIPKTSMKVIGAGMAAAVAWSKGPNLLSDNANHAAHAAVNIPYITRRASNDDLVVEQPQAEINSIASINKQTKIIIGSGVALVASGAALVTNGVRKRKKTSDPDIADAATESVETVFGDVEKMKATENSPSTVPVEAVAIKDIGKVTDLQQESATTHDVEHAHVNEGKVDPSVHTTPAKSAEEAEKDKTTVANVMSSLHENGKTMEHKETPRATEDDSSDDSALFLSNTRQKIKDFFTKPKSTEESGVSTETAIAVAPLVVSSTASVSAYSPITTKLEKLFRITSTTNTPVAPRTRADIAKARKQPKSIAEEKKLAAKYVAIESLEDRSFQILVDLGMVEIHTYDLEGAGEWE